MQSNLSNYFSKVHLLKKGEDVPDELAARVEAAQKANNESSQKAAGDAGDSHSTPSDDSSAPLKDKVNRKISPL